MVLQVFSNWQLNPLLLINNALRLHLLHDLKLILGTDAALEEDLRSTEGAGRENDLARRADRDDVGLSVTVGDLETGDDAVLADDALDLRIVFDVDILAGKNSEEVGAERAAALAFDVLQPVSLVLGV